jgi:PAS domain S-box-containing protein
MRLTGWHIRGLVSVLGFVWLLILGGGGFALIAATDTPPAVLTNFIQVYALAKADLEKGLPVRIEAWVTYYDPDEGVFLLHDGKTGVFQDLQGRRYELDTGSRIELTGLTSARDTVSRISPFEVRVLTNAPLPLARRVKLPDLLSSMDVQELVEVTGKVLWTQALNDRFAFALESDEKSLLVFIRASAPTNLAWYTDAELSVSGVCVYTPTSWKSVSDKQLYVGHSNQIRVLSPVLKDPFAGTIIPLGQLENRKSTLSRTNRVLVSGHMIKQELGHSIVIRQDSASIRAFTQQPDSLAEGTLIVASGFPALEGATLVLRKAVFREIPEGIKPPVVMPELITNTAQFYTLPPDFIKASVPVKIEGVVTFDAPDWSMLVIQDDTGGLYHELDPSAPYFELGEKIELKGKSMLKGADYRITDCEYRRLPGGRLPTPRRMSVEELLAAPHKLDWTEIEGPVCWTEMVGGRPSLCIGSGNRYIIARVREPSSLDVSRLTDAVIRVQGIPGVTKEPWTPNSSVILLVPNSNFVQVLIPQRDDPFKYPVMAIREVMESRPAKGPAKRVKIQGYLVHQQTAESLTVRDNTGTIDILSSQPTQLPVGTPVDVSGYAVRTGSGLVLSNGVFQHVLQNPTPLASSRPSLVTNAATSFQLPLTQIDQIRALSAKDANLGLPVHLQAVVTLHRPEIGMLFVQDPTGGLYVFIPSSGLSLRPGQLIDLNGVTESGLFAPIVRQPQIKILGEGPLPPAFLHSLEQLATGERDSQLVQVRGFVRECYGDGNDVNLQMEDNGIPFTATVMSRLDPEKVKNSLVRIRGVASGRFDDHRQITGIIIWAQSDKDLTVEQTLPRNPYQQPLVGISDLGDYELARRLNEYVKIQGTVLLQAPGRYLFLQEGTQAVAVHTKLAGQWKRGDRVEAVGFLGREGRKPVLRHALLRRIGSGKVPAPDILPADRMLDPQCENRWIQVTAKLLNESHRAEESVLTLQIGGWVFDAVCTHPDEASTLKQFQPGSVLAVTGVYTVHTDYARVPKVFRLEFESPEDVKIVQQPPWWTVRRVMMLFGVAMVITLAALMWGRSLHRTVREQTQQIRRRLEKEAALERKHRELVNNARDPIFTVDLQGRFVSINPAFQRIMQYNPEEVVRLTLTELAGPVSLPLVKKMLERGTETDGKGTFEVEMLTQSGNRVFLELSSRRILEDGQPQGFQIIARDVTERHTAEEALRLSEESLVLSQHIGKVGSWGLDFRTQALSWSAETHRIFGQACQASEPSLDIFYKAVHSADREAVRHAVEEALYIGAQFSIDHRIVLPDGTERWVHEQAEVMRDAQGAPAKLTGTVQDITERRHLEEQLRQAQKMEAIGILAGGVAHDFNNILTVIHGHVEIMQSRAPTDPRTVNSLREVGSAAQRASNLTRQLLTFSRCQPIQPRVLDLNEVVENLTKMLRRLIGEHIQLQCSYVPQLPPVFADAGMIEQVIMNLAVNARDAMPDGGRLRLATSIAILDSEAAAHNPEARPGHFVVLSVTDTGCGMDDATMARIFEPFFTTKEIGKGTGLGLATAYGIVKQHEGWISVMSAVDTGTTFDVYLPVAAPAKSTISATAPEPEIQGGTETILVVEDEEPLRCMVAEVLTHLGYTVHKASNGPEALEFWAQNRDQIDLLFTDMVMPQGMTGLELAKRMTAEKTSLHVVYTSGYSVELAAQERHLREGTNYLQKPFQPQKLARTIRNCFKHPPMVIGPQVLNLKVSV